MPTPSRRARALTVAALLGAVASTAAAQPTPRSGDPAAGKDAPGETITLPVSGPERPFVVATPDAFESAATDPATKLPWRVRARVIVRAADAAPINDHAKALGLAPKVRPAGTADAPIPGFWLADCASVRDAARLAAALRSGGRVAEASLDTLRPRALRNLPTDPSVPQQWYLHNAAVPFADLNVIPAWKAGITGAGVTVGLVEGGFNESHPDLAANFNAAASQAPPPGWPAFDDHGTATAGLVGMVANNGIGGAGVAYGAKISRQYFGFDTDNADAFLFANSVNAIKSNSWGPTDNGTLGPVTSIELAALQTAATTGRGGKGEVFLWAGGNGAAVGDRTDYDQYASNRFAIAVGAIDNQDRRASYSEAGSSLMLVTTSSFDFFGSDGSGIFSTVGSSTTGAGQYFGAFGGTSAASPIAAGVCALVLQANPNLTARDVANVLIRSARRVNPADEGWVLNGAGRWVNDAYGFGAIDAGAAVLLAPGVRPRGPERSYSSPVRAVAQDVPDNSLAGVTSTIVVPQRLDVERVQVVLNAPHPRLGDYTIELTSPSGTRSLLALTRSDSSFGYAGWVFTSVRHWDERSNGPWTLRVSDRAPGQTGRFEDWQLLVYAATPPCPCDWNARGGADILDIFDFLGDWFAGAADFDGNGQTDLPDIFAFLGCWFAGCP